jgi:hypothetical protein
MKRFTFIAKMDRTWWGNNKYSKKVRRVIVTDKILECLDKQKSK